MIQVKQFVLNPFQENTYILFDETSEAIIIDAGCYTQQEVESVGKFVHSKGLKVKFLVNTHGHIDHVLGIDSLRDLFKVECLAHASDLPLFETAPSHALMFGLSINKAPSVDKTIKEGDQIKFGNSTIEVIHTPGHTMGGICLYLREQGMLFTGDTLFRGSIGRTDLAGGNYESIIESIIYKILPLGDDIVVYPGHGDSTTIEFEKRSNPFLIKN